MLKSRYFTAGLAIIVLFLGLSLIRIQQPIQDLNAEISHINQKLDEVKSKNDDLSQRADYLNNKSYLEQQLRLRFNYKKSDEEAVLIYKTQPPVQQSESNNLFIKGYNKFSSWLKSIFGK